MLVDSIVAVILIKTVQQQDKPQANIPNIVFTHTQNLTRKQTGILYSICS